MNKDNAAQYLPLVQALAEGKTIQFGSDKDGWADILITDFANPPKNYRIKPEPRRVWVNFYANGAIAAFESKESAPETAVEFVEVLK